MQTLFKGSKTELQNEADGSNRTAGTADTLHKTYDSSKTLAKNGYPSKPPMSGGVDLKLRPQSGATS